MSRLFGIERSNFIISQSLKSVKLSEKQVVAVLDLPERDNLVKLWGFKIFITRVLTSCVTHLLAAQIAAHLLTAESSVDFCWLHLSDSCVIY